MSTDFEECLSKIRNNEHTLASREEHAVELGVILPLLRWADWDTEDLTQIYPQRPLPTLTNTGKVDFDLQIGGKSRIFIEGKRWNHPLRENVEEEQLREYCVAGKPDLAVLTNGRQWLFYLPPTKRKPKLRQFLALDIISDNDRDIEQSFRRFLSYESIQAIRTTCTAAKKLYDDHATTAVVLKGLRDAWNELVHDQEKLKDVLRHVTQDSDIQPSDDQLVKFLESSGNLVNVVDDRPSTGPRSLAKPRSFTLPEAGVTEPVTVKHWNELNHAICDLMYERHPDRFKVDVLGIPGGWFSESSQHGNQIGDTGIYVRWGGSAEIRTLCHRVVASFGYPEGSLTIEERGGNGSPGS